MELKKFLFHMAIIMIINKVEILVRSSRFETLRMIESKVLPEKEKENQRENLTFQVFHNYNV